MIPTSDRRSDLALIALILLALLWPVLSGAQVLELTPDTACGAPGVGTVRVIRDGAERWVAEARHGTPGQRVGRDGRWHTGCQMPPACAARRTYQWADQQSGALCTPTTSELRASPELGRVRQVHAIGRGGAIVGRAVYACTATGWALVPGETYCRGR